MKTISSTLFPFLPAVAALWLSSCASFSPTAPLSEDAAVIDSPAMAKRLQGRHPISLQWISWQDYGSADVIRSSDGVIRLVGEQRSSAAANNDYLRIDGRITRITDTGFLFDGVIECRVSYILDGEPYRRTGPQEFFLYGDRGFWRLRDMKNEEGSVDYVDIYFDLETARASNAEWVD